jgi:hypothetical protein
MAMLGIEADLQNLAERAYPGALHIRVLREKQLEVGFFNVKLRRSVLGMGWSVEQAAENCVSALKAMEG